MTTRLHLGVIMLEQTRVTVLHTKDGDQLFVEKYYLPLA